MTTVNVEKHVTPSSAIVASPATGTLIKLGRTQHTLKLAGAETGGQYMLMEARMQPHTLVVPHVHTHEDELLIAQEGELGARIGDQEFHIGPGSYLFAPRGVPHALWNRTSEANRGISIFTPAGLEGFFEEMGEIFAAGGPPDHARLGAVSRKYGIVSVMEWVPELSAKYGVST